MGCHTQKELVVVHSCCFSHLGSTLKTETQTAPYQPIPLLRSLSPVTTVDSNPKTSLREPRSAHPHQRAQIFPVSPTNPDLPNLTNVPRSSFRDLRSFLSEKDNGFHQASAKFAENSISKTGRKLDSVTRPHELPSSSPH
ncbi:hypothetical protein G4B88_011044, partial [Cannabis sativa]